MIREFFRKVWKIPNWLKLLTAFLAGSFFQPIIEDLGRKAAFGTVYDERPKIYHCIPVSAAKVVIRGDEGKIIEVNPTTFFNETTIMIDNTTDASISDFRVTIIPFGSINEHPVPMYSSVVTSSIAYADSIRTTFRDTAITLEMPVFPKNTQIMVRNILNEPISYYVEMSSPEERHQIQLNPSCEVDDEPLFLPVSVKQKFSEFCKPNEQGDSFGCDSPAADIKISDEMREHKYIDFEIIVDRTDGREAEYQSMSKTPRLPMKSQDVED